ncbi:uncharacterized protein LAJ45_08439 [Morchella importuna]|uniref:UVI-1 protein n=1 Tax=Morchella conica CCBAS932 TaxID=1392247 RepID=A0A3N4KN70_9PEZI|nr:uncharacterized protein LAJ45_08439 [Morchella importuna]KAH8147611.1 hypothetical protein LAJ45_08439 [Morchella importuna]RPB07275.1 hypothetical protein P167DRAFT_496043 [Morchella conica CCBAS932]
MRFSTIIVGTLAAFGLVAAQATPAQQIVQAFKEITTLSDNLRIDTQKINLINAPLQGYKIAQGFAAIITRVGQASAMLSGGSSRKTRRQMAPLADADAQLVVGALTTFVQVHQALLNVVIGKHGLLTLIPFFEPIRQALVSLEATVDTFAFYLIAMIPTQKPAADTQFGSLTVTVKFAITTYEQPL